MGLTIHYSGTIKDIRHVPGFVEELTDIADSMGWMTQPINADETDPHFRGVIVNPKGDCEPLCFIFDRDGRLRPLMDLLSEPAEPTQYSFGTATKTQFADSETHVWIVGLLRYLKKHHIPDLEVSDEGDYWETGDLRNLREKKQFLQGMIDRLSDAVSDAEPLPDNASIEDLAMRIEAIVQQMRRE